MTELIVALDAPFHRSLELYLALRGTVRWFKVGVPMLLEEGGRVLAEIIAKNDNSSLMLDLKAYDTKDTVHRAVDAAVRMGAAMLTVHADCVPDEDRLRIIAVRRLTDGTAGNDPIAWETTASGFVCPFSHVNALRQLTGKYIITPGIRLPDSASDNHASTATPRQAAEAGADFIVVGRPIYDAPNPVQAAEAILRDLADAAQRS